MNEGRPILVAGKSGQLARCLVDAAARLGVRLVAVGRPDLDVENPASIDRTMGAAQPQAIVNAAAYTAVDRAESEPDKAFAVNREGAARLAAAAAKSGIPFIHISTDYVFDGRKSTPYHEDDIPGPLGVYGRSKLEGEIAVRQACSSALVLRTPWLYSPYGHNFVKTMLNFAETRPTVRVVDDQHGTPTAASDLAEVILQLLRRSQRQSDAGIYHLAASGETTWYGFAEAIFSGWARRGRHVPRLERIVTAEYPAAAVRPANSRLDCGKIARSFGISLPDWRASLETCLDALSAAHAETSRC